MADGRVAEQVLLEEYGVQVTSTRLVVRGQTFAMANITSVRMIPDAKRAAKLYIGISCFLLLFPPVGIPMLIGSIVVYLSTKAQLVLVTAGGETKALKAKQPFVEKVVAALNEAIIARG